MTMRLLITGPNGQLGSDLGRINEEDGFGFDLITLAHGELDLTSTEAIGSAVERYDYDVLVNCAAYNRVDDAERNVVKAHKVNSLAVGELAAAAKLKGAGFVHVSTDYVFDGRVDRPYVETDRAMPLSVYGQSKYDGEVAALTAHDRAVVVRTASLFGVAAAASAQLGNFVETVMKICEEKGEMRVVDDVTMSPTNSEDLARMLLRLIEEGCEGGLYHGVNSGSATWCDFAKAIVEMAGLDASVVPIDSDEYPRPAKRPHYSVLNNEKMAGIIGDMPHWRDALKRYFVTRERLTGGVI